MKLDPKQYDALRKKASPPSPVLKDCTWAFFVGGGICCIGEALGALYQMLHFGEKEAAILTSASLVALSAIFTGLGWYQKLASKAGAGTLVPITGFANAVVSPAIEFRCEGLIPGVGAKMFIIAGPVIVYGVLASVIWGFVLYFLAPYFPMLGG